MESEPAVTTSARIRLLGIALWLWVGLPFMFGLYELVVKIPALFTS